MLSNTQIKLYKSLHTKKFRLKEKKYVIEGHRLIQEAINANAKLLGAWCSKKYIENNPKFITVLKNSADKFESTSTKSLSQICDSQNNQGVVAILSLPEHVKFEINHQPILLLDNISDPGNMGTILRTANWFGIKGVVLSHECVDPYNSKVLRSAMGAHFHIKQIVQDDLSQIILQLKKDDYTIIAADMDGTSLDEFNAPKKWALILGSEAHGLSKAIMPLLDEQVTIPKSGNIESLNVSVATGVALYGVLARRNKIA